MGQIIFLRHGQAENNIKRVLAGRTEGIPLTPTGVTQAQDAAKFLSEMDISAIYSSPIQRADDTAKIVAEYNNLDVISDDRLIELDMGKFTGMAYDDIFQTHGNVFLKFYNGELEIAHNGVETFAEVKSRVTSITKHVMDKHHNENVVLVTHMDPIKAMLSMAVDLSSTNLFELVIANASLNIFYPNENGFTVGGLNVMHPTRFGQVY